MLAPELPFPDNSARMVVPTVTPVPDITEPTVIVPLVTPLTDNVVELVTLAVNCADAPMPVDVSDDIVAVVPTTVTLCPVTNG